MLDSGRLQPKLVLSLRFRREKLLAELGAHECPPPHKAELVSSSFLTNSTGAVALSLVQYP